MIKVKFKFRLNIIILVCGLGMVTNVQAGLFGPTELTEEQKEAKKQEYKDMGKQNVNANGAAAANAGITAADTSNALGGLADDATGVSTTTTPADDGLFSAAVSTAASTIATTVMGACLTAWAGTMFTEPTSGWCFGVSAAASIGLAAFANDTRDDMDPLGPPPGLTTPTIPPRSPITPPPDLSPELKKQFEEAVMTGDYPALLDVIDQHEQFVDQQLSALGVTLDRKTGIAHLPNGKSVKVSDLAANKPAGASESDLGNMKEYEAVLALAAENYKNGNVAIAGSSDGSSSVGGYSNGSSRSSGTAGVAKLKAFSLNTSSSLASLYSGLETDGRSPSSEGFVVKNAQGESIHHSQSDIFGVVGERYKVKRQKNEFLTK